MEKLLSNLPRRTRRALIAVAGGVVLIVGIVMIPYPGPGWLVVFMGLAILAQEFAWAKRALYMGKEKYDAWNSWIKRQNLFVRSLTFIATGLIVIATIWFLNGYGLINSWLHLGWPWLRSPLPWFSALHILR